MNNTLAEVIAKRPQDLLVPNEEIKKEALKTVQESFNPIAKQYSIFDQLHVDGLDAEQVWTQAQMIVDGVVEKLLGEDIPRLAGNKRSADDMSDSDSEDEEGEGSEMADSQEEGEEFDIPAEDDNEMLEEDDDDDEDEGEEDEGDQELESDEEDQEEEDDNEQTVQSNELDDNVFRLEDFQKQVLDMERDNNGDDDEEIDYFGDIKDDEEDEGGYRYEDFFDPPKKTTKNKNNKKKKVKFEDDKEDAETSDHGFDYNSTDKDIIETMESMKKDMFESDSEPEEDEETARLSRHERESLEIAQQIRKLEEENVAEKHWAVKGEAKAKDRPENSLLETELNFERSSKPVPVVTQEFNDSIEELIKKRVENNDFDDIPRRLPDSLPEFRPSRGVDVQETKSQKSLAELYEEDYEKSNNPEYKSAQSEQLDAAHKEVLDLYNKVAFNLDALCAWNYTPKAPKPTISIVSNTPTIAMEDAQPSTASGDTMLAPQEVYKPQATSKREVLGKDGLLVAKSEMSREERKRARRREKTKRAKVMNEREETQKARAQKDGSNANIMQSLKKGNVTVIGKHGEKRDVSGNLKKEKQKATGKNLKL